MKKTGNESFVGQAKRMLMYDIDNNRSRRRYLNFTVKKNTDERPEKDMMAVPIVGEPNFEYVTIGEERRKIDKLEFAYVPMDDVKKLQQNKVYSFEQHNSFLSRYKKRTLYCLNPNNYEFDIGLSIVSYEVMNKSSKVMTNFDLINFIPFLNI